MAVPLQRVEVVSARYFMLYVSFDLNVDTMITDTKKVEEIVGKEACGSGAGMGQRDVEFYYDDKTERDDAAARVRKHAGYTINLASYPK